MNLTVYFTIMITVLLIGVIGTLMIGFSNQNREGAPTYLEKTGSKWARLTLLYVVSGIICVVALIIFIAIW